MLKGLKSVLQGRFMNHPLHPIFVHIPIGLWLASFIFDVAFMVNGNTTLAAASYYCMLLGLVGVLLAAPTGLAEFVEIPKGTLPKRIATTHMLLNIFVSVLFLVNVLARHSLENGAPSIVTRGQLFLSLFSILILGVSGYLGGLLAYNYGIGFKPQLRGRDHHLRTEPRSNKVA